MKQKIFILTLCFIFIFNTISFGNEKNISNIEYHISKNVDSNGILYVDENGVSNQRSATAIAIGGSVASSILALATKAGITFLSTQGMDEFLYRFLALDTSAEIVGAISDCIKNSVGGVINFSRSLLDTIKAQYDKVVTFKDIQYLNIGNANIPILSESLSTGDYLGKLINTTSGGVYFVTSNEVGNSGSKEYNIMGNPVKIKYQVEERNSTSSSSKIYIYYQKDGVWTSALGSDSLGDKYMYQSSASANVYALPYITIKGSSYYLSLVHHYTRFETWGTETSTYRSITSVKLNNISYVEKSIDTTLGDAWSGSIGGDSENISVKIPSNMGQLVGQPSESVSDNPTYDTWKPGKDVTIPGVDTPSVGITPETPSDTDAPSDTDTPSDTPGEEEEEEGSGLWDWLKNLIQAILGILQNIWNWITSFWDTFTTILGSVLSSVLSSIFDFSWLSNLINTIIEWLSSFWETLLDFITGLFVPSDSYWTDKVTELTGEIKNKYPHINIGKLEELAVGEKVFEDIYGTFFGQKCLIVRASIINNIIGWARPILQGLICIFLLIFNYNQLYKMLRNGSLSNASESSHKK